MQVEARKVQEAPDTDEPLAEPGLWAGRCTRLSWSRLLELTSQGTLRDRVSWGATG